MKSNDVARTNCSIQYGPARSGMCSSGVYTVITKEFMAEMKANLDKRSVTLEDTKELKFNSNK